MPVLPVEMLEDIVKLAKMVNQATANSGEVYLQDKIEIMYEQEPLGARLVDDGMGEATYYVEFYDGGSDDN